MGSSFSHEDAPPPPPPAPANEPPSPYADVPPPPLPPQEEDKAAEDDKVDYLNLRCPIPYEEAQREAMMTLKPELFEGFRFDFVKPVSQVFFLSHSASMGSLEVPSQGPEVIKVATSNYEFGANYIDPKLMLIGRIAPDGRLSGRVKYDLTKNLCLKLNAQLTNEPGYSQGMGSLDYKGKDFRTQCQFGNNGFYGTNYIQSVTKNLSLGTEGFWLGQQSKSGVGFLARYDTKKMVATGQIASTGLVSLSYVQKVSEKVSLATDFMYNHMSKDVIASVGYDYIMRQSRLRGKVDTNGTVSALLEERINQHATLVLSAEVDHWKKDNKFGIGINVGE
ncbi:mitochondrial import receptor subunit TOM40-1-like [Hordeum vulgare subsp. vulgare]|uniref:Mitochondrial import receptor subunit TOM40 n=1 Tax=Hordeum vulgare subsp. vulgare TaxID=112509 RepID=A0A8I6XTH9_HORVV|nr:mitochondrial import receptor subunit TOM40-1-like [Hordeum vulgare subsp. vulgare]KAI5006738.1 hypothetical protein ZWY2020_033981 [Hordeum vulgare]